MPKPKQPLSKEELEKLQMEVAERSLEMADFYKQNRIYAFRERREHEFLIEDLAKEKIFTPPNPKQKLILDAWEDPKYKVFTLTGGNRLGKTHLGAIIAICVMAGKWLWNDKPIWFPHKKPRKVRWIGQGWESHIKTVLLPKLELLWPKCRPVDTKKNNQGIESNWKDKVSGSTLEIWSNEQESRLQEGWDGDLVIYDEPPKRDIRIVNARGLVDRMGRELLTATLISAGWVRREIIRARLENGSPDPRIFNVRGATRDNLGYGLTQEGIDDFSSKLSAKERKVRLEGESDDVDTLVFYNFDRDKHVREPFKVPLDWIVDISIDFHPSRPWAVVFLATARNNFKYVCHELHLRGNPKFVGEEIVRWVKQNNIRVGKCVIDPLAKGDTNNDQTVYAILEETLGAYGISLDVASKDKDNGIALVNGLLWTENEMPGLYFFRDCPITIQQTEDLSFDPETFKPEKVEDDFTEALYRLALLNTEWYPEVNYNMSSQRSVLL